MTKIEETLYRQLSRLLLEEANTLGPQKRLRRDRVVPDFFCETGEKSRVNLLRVEG